MQIKRKIIFNFVYFCLLLSVFFSLPADADGQNKNQTKQAAKLVAEADAVFRQKDYRAAIDKYTGAIALIPSLSKAHFGKGNAHIQLNEYDQAISEMDAALAGGYKPIEIYKIRWVLYLKKKNYDLALQDAQKVLQLEPRNTDLNQAIGEIQLARGSYQEALDIFQKSIQIDPNNADTYYYIASANAGLGNTEQQIIAATEAIKRNTRYLGESNFLIAEALRKNKKNVEALEFYQKTISAKPEIYAAYHNLSDIHRTQNQLKEAIEVTKKGLQVLPEDGNLYIDLARYYSLSNSNFEAIIAATCQRFLSRGFGYLSKIHPNRPE